MLLLFFLCFLAGASMSYSYVRRRTKPRFLLHVEYWVYLPGERLPSQDETMTRLVRPPEGPPAIGAAEALLFSDVRLHIALVLRSKNAYLFRPDLIEPSIDATASQLERLAGAKSFAKVRFISEEPVPDRRYLTFLPQLARILAELGEGSLVYDPVGERLLDPEALKAGDPGPDARWHPEPSGGHIETRGLKKVGLPEIRTESIAADERWIASEVIEQVARTAWKVNDLPPSVTIDSYHDRFRIDFERLRDGFAKARIHRVRPL